MAAELKARPYTLYLTGHCTGSEAYGILRELLGEQIGYMATGTAFTV